MRSKEAHGYWSEAAASIRAFGTAWLTTRNQ